MTGTFRSLANYNYRLWAGGALVSNVGTWMQRTAQAWLVLAQLTRHNASAVGLVTALQFAPLVLFLPLTGYVADRFDRRKVLVATQGGMGLLALVLGAFTVTGHVTVWEVDVFAFLFGSVSAFDAPARQSFVTELVGERDLSNAVALNSTSFNAGRMIGPAVAGMLIATVGTGWAFVLNALSFAFTVVALLAMRERDLHRAEGSSRPTGGLAEGFRYVWNRPDLRAVLVMLFFIGTFGLNFPIFISTMAVSVFHAGAGPYGLLMSIMAIGTVAGALLAARRESPQVVQLLGGSVLFGTGCALAALMPAYWLFGVMLVVIGIASQTFTTSANSFIQLRTDRAMRGRVMALYLTIALGGTPIGAPVVGWVADAFGPRWALGVGAAAGFAAAIVALVYLRSQPTLVEAASPVEREVMPLPTSTVLRR